MRITSPTWHGDRRKMTLDDFVQSNWSLKLFSPARHSIVGHGVLYFLRNDLDRPKRYQSKDQTESQTEMAARCAYGIEQQQQTKRYMPPQWKHDGNAYRHNFETGPQITCVTLFIVFYWTKIDISLFISKKLLELLACWTLWWLQRLHESIIAQLTRISMAGSNAVDNNNVRITASVQRTVC